MKKQTLLDEVQMLPLADLNSLEIANTFLKHLKGRKLTMEDNPEHHLCVYTLPYHKQTKKILIGHHIKANKWLAPGGHIDGLETLKQTATREIREELAENLTEMQISDPFFVSISHITNSKPPRKCQTHYDIWIYFSLPTLDSVLDASEFYESKWASLEEAIKLTTDQANKDALTKFSRIIGM